MPKCSVLIVDDDPAILDTLRVLLQFEGYPTETASNGQEALELVAQQHPALVLLDMRMPILDGWGFARKIEDRRCELKILVMTAAQDARRWADEIHADGYVPKPFDIQQLLGEVERLCPDSA
jgi:CheY-like chemotaxis protein